MNGLGKNYAHLKRVQGKFERLIGQVTKTAAPRSEANQQQSRASLREVASFGTNPGNLRMHMHVPARLADKPPLVVALHGCGQSAAEYAVGTGWSKLAEQLGFVVLYPEQQPANNPKSCFSWFVPDDVRRGDGEAHSIHQMVQHVVAAYGTDRSRVFVTGLSAGGAMANVMLAAYPDTFAAGAIIAGLPYGTAASVQEAFSAMFTDQQHSPRDLGDRVRSASPSGGPWPRIAIWHGTADQIVRPGNADLIARQWADVHGIASEPSFEGLHGRHARRLWNDADGNTLIESFAIDGMAHGVPLDTSAGNAAFGSPGPFFLDADISSTQHIARFWGLGEVDGATVQTELPADGVERGPHVPRAERPNDAGEVIAAAFKAAGLPLGGMNPNSHSQIIEAALKAAGLKR
jgi:poly(hydroxyalkanoate) depolymerase family esterase